MTEGVRLRRDAQRNLERLMAAAAEAFRERGLQVPLEEIAQRAGVSPGTLYNRFRGRDALIDAVMPALVEAGVRDALARAETVEDPWEALTLYVTLVCELQAGNPALNDAVSRRFPDAEALTAICDAQMDQARGLLERAQRAGAVRPDCTAEDLAYLFWSTATIVRATAAAAPRTWRRALAINLDGLRARAAGPPLPEPPMTAAQVHRSMLEM
ncbi:TetR/AcrR family transcriptional regulator [Dactylosporangium sp. McL0621]|uniref:TetR/AcrR family transcriptional regulator n=1 Tax=Dactylosporangium sp. McL0621 TaxID=3415678 RepID=UPI003CEC4B26